jgi:hypothetical protein
MSMSHLTAERLAALADGPPTAPEQTHLDACPACCREREAYRALATLAWAERARIGPPVSSWDAIAAGLRAEGGLRESPAVASPLSLVSVPNAPATRPQRDTHVVLHVPRWAMRAAAALLLVAGGVVAGRVSAPAGGGSADAGATNAANPGVRNASLVTFRTRQEAEAAMQVAEQQYISAAEYLARNDSTVAPAPEASAAEVYRTRLAAFDGVLAATQQALFAAPADPIINRNYLATIAARDFALKQLSLVAPAGVQINRY